jgi:hypothetical protein
LRTRFPWLVVVLTLLVVAAPAAAQASTGRLTARYTAIPLKSVSRSTLSAQSVAGATVHDWSGSIVSPVNGATYQYTMVGKNPRVTQSTPTTSVGVDLIPVKLVFDNGTMDPAVATAGCSTKTPLALTNGSPVFATHAYTAGTTSVGTHQYLDAFQRENFAKYVLAAGALNPGYNVNLSKTVRAELTVTVPSADGTIVSYGGSCGNLGQMDINWWDNYVRGTLLPSLEASATTSVKRFPFFLFSNAVMYDGSSSNCCIIGYHSAASVSTGTQTYGVGDYDTTNLFGGLSDIGAISHEFGEWMDDPFVNNATPAWGHTGQVSGCQANLEVGDPLSGTSVTVKMGNGVTYHPQELAFFSWFYRQSPSIGVNGWYSSNDTFTSGAGPVCS